MEKVHFRIKRLKKSKTKGKHCDYCGNQPRQVAIAKKGKLKVKSLLCESPACMATGKANVLRRVDA